MYRLAAAALTAFSLALPAAALDLDAMSPDERAAFGAAVREYLMENPQVIMDAVAVLEEQQAAAQAQADVLLVENNADALFNDGISFVGGNPDGDITLVEFLDYRCGFCRRAHPEVARLLSEDGNIRLIVKEFPILGDQSMLASRFALATKLVAGDDAYKQVSDALIEFPGEYSMPALTRLASGFDLDAGAITAQMDAEEVTQILQANRELAQRLQITGTPTFVMGDELIRGFLPYEQMAELVEEIRG